MKKEKILKTIIVLIMISILFFMTTNVFAATDSGIDFWEDQTNQLDDNDNETDSNTNTDTNTNTNTNVNTNTSIDLGTNTNTNTSLNDATTSNNYNTSLPKAGATENTMMGVAITVLAIVAIYAYKKIREYKNI